MEINGNTYQVGTLNAFDQLMVVKRLGLALPVVEGVMADRNAGKDIRLLMVLLIAQLEDADVKFIFDKCLATVTRRQQDMTWARVLSNGVPMFSDMGLDEMLKLTSEVLITNLGDFFNSALTSLKEGATKQ